MTWSVMSDVPNPLFDVNGNPYSGAVLKAYLPGTTTSTSIAIDSAGGSPQTSITYNAEGKLEVSGNEILPYIDRKHKWGIFANATDATANTPFYMGPFDNVEKTADSVQVVKQFATLALAVADTGLVDGDVLTTGDRGGATWDVVLASTVTPNTYDIVQCTGVATLALVLRVNGEINVTHLGADTSGTVDNKALLDFAALNYDAVYLPNGEGQVYGLSDSWEVLVHFGFSIRADNPKRSSGQLLKALAPMESVLQILDGSATPGENILTLLKLENVSIDGNNLATFGLACGKFGSTTNQLVKMVKTESLAIVRCRIGYVIGGADSIETDSAGYTNTNTVIEECTDGGLLIDTGNGAAINFIGSTFNDNGFNPTNDTFNVGGDGFNYKVVGGELNLVAGTSAGAGTVRPRTADIIVSSADIRINGHWSDTHGICVLESGGSDASVYINGLRHNEGGMTSTIQSISSTNPMVVQSNSHPFVIGDVLTIQDVVGTVEANGLTGNVTSSSTNTITLDIDASTFTAYVSGGLISSTPVSIKHVCKMNIEGSLLHGKVESNEGNSGSLTIMGVNFVSSGTAKSNSTAYTGTLKTNQKSIISINNFGNRAQLAIGGGSVDMAHKGFFTPQLLQIGAGNSATGPTALSQALGPLSGDSGFTTQLDTAGGTQILYVNCYPSDNAGNIAPIITTKDSHIIDLGGGTFSALRMRRHKFTSTTPVASSTFQDIFTVLQGADDTKLAEVVLVPPKLAADPTFSSGDYWEGGFYYNTTTNKHRANTGSSTWADMY